MAAYRFAQIGELLEKARALAVQYYRLTGKPLGITGEVGEYEAARLLGLELMSAREPGYDALETGQRKLQIKTRAIAAGKRLSGQRLGTIDTDKEWHAVLLVLLNEEFQPLEIHEASREAIVAVVRPPSEATRTWTQRGALTVSKFKSIGRLRWKRD